MNSTMLDTARKPVVMFNPSIAQHRQWVEEFCRVGSWSQCPVLFHAPLNISVKAHTAEVLLGYYLSTEFKQVAPTVATKIKSKRKSAVRLTAGKLFKAA